MDTCDVVISSAGKLKAEKIIHAVGPRFRESDLEEKLRKTIANALAIADESGIRRLAFPAMGRGFYGIPLPVSARHTVGVIDDYLARGDTGLGEITICVTDHVEVSAFQDELGKTRHSRSEGR